MTDIPGDIPLRYSCTIAGLRLSTNRSASFNDPFTTVGSLRVLFTPEQVQHGDNSAQAYSPPHWHLLPGSEISPAILCHDGEFAIIQENPSESLDHATQLRRVVPFAAALQGKLVLHTSSIRYKHSVIAFIGPSGVGKSTLVEHLAQLGYAILSDDLLPCRIIDEQVSVPLDPDLPLRAIYFLRRDKTLAKLECTPLSRPACWLQLLKHGFGELDVPRVWEAQFMDYHHIARLVPAYQLTLPDNLSLLEKSMGTLISHMENIEAYQPELVGNLL